MSDIWTIGSILKWTGQYFGEKGVENPRLDAEVLLSHILGRDRLYLYTHYEQPLEQAELAAFRECVRKRAARLPVAYITGHKEFMGLTFRVGPAVLVPRPDTEILVEAAMKRLQGLTAPAILDLGTGSGAIIVSLLSNLPAAAGTAVDISGPALAIAGQNAGQHAVAERLTLLEGDLFGPVQGLQFDAVVSNPPYIPADEIADLAAEVRQEPRGALDGGQDGLDFYRRILAEAAGFLKPGGFVALEVGMGQAPAVTVLARNAELGLVEVCRDLGGIERVVVAFRR